MLTIVVAGMVALSAMVLVSPTASAKPDTLRMLTTKEWFQDGPTGAFSVTAADLDLDGTVEVIVGGVSYPYQTYPPPPPEYPRGYLAVFHYGGCQKTLQLLDYKVWDAGLPNRDTFVSSVVVGDFATDPSHPGLEIVTMGNTMVGSLHRGELRLWVWAGNPRTLQLLGSPRTWPSFTEPNTYAYSAFAANVDTDPDIEVTTAGMYGSSPDVRVWSWSGTSFQPEAGSQFTTHAPAAWMGVSVGNVDEDLGNVQEIVTAGHGTNGGDTDGLLQIWHKVGSNLLPQLGQEYTWPSAGHEVIANSTYVGPVDAPNDIRILTVGTSTDASGRLWQEMKVFDWDGIQLSNPATNQWRPTAESDVRGNGVYAAEVDMDGQVEMLAVGVAVTSGVASALLSVWHWDGPPQLIDEETHITWRDPYVAALGRGVYAANANGDADGIPEILTAGDVSYIVHPPDPPASRDGQLRMWDWNLSYSQTWAWYTGGASPPARDEHGMAYYESARRTIMFGGENPPRLFDDTWEFDTSVPTAHTWRPLTTTGGITARRDFAMTYDSSNDRIVLFGGRDASGAYLQETWGFEYKSPPTASVWTNRNPASPVPSGRYAPAMVFDEAHGVFVLFGGRESPTTYPVDTWEYDYGANTWRQYNRTTHPGGRVEHMMAFDCKRGVTVLFGGEDNGGTFGDTWEYNAETHNWTQKSSGDLTARIAPSMDYDWQGEVVVLVGGSLQTTYYGDTWAYDGTTWTEMPVDPAHPIPRNEAWMAYDGIANRHVFFGGYNGQVRNDTHEYRYS